MGAAFTGYEITSGGLLRRLERAVRISRGDERDWLRCAAAVVLVTYVPALLFGLGWRLVTGDWPPGLTRLDTHVRPLVTIPLLLAAEPLVEARARDAGHYLFESGLVSQVGGPYAAAVARTVRWRDSHAVEVVLLLAAIGFTLTGETYVGGAAEVPWASMPSLLVFRFLLLRWLWRWTVWGVFLRRLVRLPLALRATHPDRVAGLGPLLGPAQAFAAVIAAGGCELASLAASLELLDEVSMTAFSTVAVAYALVATCIAVAPGGVFVPVLYQTRNHGLRGYGGFARRFTEAFEERWFGATGAEALTAPDMSTLNDLGQSYQVVGEIQLLTWGRRIAVLAAAAAVAPMLPVVLFHLGLHEVVQRLASALLSG